MVQAKVNTSVWASCGSPQGRQEKRSYEACRQFTGLARRGVALATLAAMLYWHRSPEFTAATAVFVLVGGFLMFIPFTASRNSDSVVARSCRSSG